MKKKCLKIALLLMLSTTVSTFASQTQKECTITNGKCNCVKCSCINCLGTHNEHQITNNKNIYESIMNNMMMNMEAVKTDTNMEINFLEQMIAHHQGAIDMAEYEVKNGKNQEMIQLAKSILAEQKAEIEEMKYFISVEKNSKNKITPEYLEKINQSMTVMMKNTPTSSSQNVDKDFAEYMIPHHQAAIDMAKALIALNPGVQVDSFAKKIISDQQIEIDLMNSYLNKNNK